MARFGDPTGGGARSDRWDDRADRPGLEKHSASARWRWRRAGMPDLRQVTGAAIAAKQGATPRQGRANRPPRAPRRARVSAVRAAG